MKIIFGTGKGKRRAALASISFIFGRVYCVLNLIVLFKTAETVLLNGPSIGFDYFQVSFYVIRMHYGKYSSKMKN